MTRLRGHRTLNAEQPLYVRRAVLTIEGETFAAGDVLPWQALGVAPRKLHQLWHARVIAHEKADEHNGAENPVELVKPITSPAPTALPAVTVQPDTFIDGGKFSVPPHYTETLDSQRVAFKATPGETVHTPSKHKRR